MAGDRLTVNLDSGSNTKRVKTDHNTNGDQVAAPLERFFQVLPPELVLEVFSWLFPLDLINLIETNHHIRNTLIKRSTANIWRQSRLNLGLDCTFPDPPAYLSEIQYTRTLFDIHCQYCQSETDVAEYEHGSSVPPVDFARFHRICLDCQTKYYSDPDSGLEDFQLPESMDEEELLEKLDEIILYFPNFDCERMFLKTDLERVVPELIALHQTAEEDEEDEGEGGGLDDYIATAKAELVPVKDFVATCMKWEWDMCTFGDFCYSWESVKARKDEEAEE